MEIGRSLTSCSTGIAIRISVDEVTYSTFVGEVSIDGWRNTCGRSRKLLPPAALSRACSKQLCAWGEIYGGFLMLRAVLSTTVVILAAGALHTAYYMTCRAMDTGLLPRAARILTRSPTCPARR